MLTLNMKMLLNGRVMLNSRYADVRTFTTYFRRKNNLYLAWCGLGIGAACGAAYSYLKIKQERFPILNADKKKVMLTCFPEVEVSRKVVSSSTPVGLELKLFQYATCPFCCKVRAFLDYYGISYDVIEVNPVLRQQVRWSQYKKVPIIIAKNDNKYEQLNDSSMIISAIMTHLIERGTSLSEIIKFYPSLLYEEDGKEKCEILNRYYLMCQDKAVNEQTKEAYALERKWRKWADDTFVHVLSPNVYRTLEEAVETFNWFSQAGDWEEHFPAWERNLIIYVGAFAMWIISKRLKKRHNLKNDVRQSFYDECNVWMKAIQRQGMPYMGGTAPNLADLAVFGVLSSIEGSRAFQDISSHTNIGTWYRSVKSSVKNHEGSNIVLS